MEDLGPFNDRPEEWALLNPLVGTSMLELGNKRNSKLSQAYKYYFTRVGYRHVSIDLNGQDDALPLDLCKPLNLGTFDMVTNLGTSEHVADQVAVWHNMMCAMHIGSVLCCATPYPGDWSWHGRFYPLADFYRELAKRNTLTVERLYEIGSAPRRMIFARLHRDFMLAPPQLIPVPTEQIWLNDGGYVGKRDL